MWEWKNLWATKTTFLAITFFLVFGGNFPYKLIILVQALKSVHLNETLSSAGDKLFFLQSGSLMVKILRLLTFNQRNCFEFYYKLLLIDHFDCWGFKGHNQKHSRPYNKKTQHNKGNLVFQKFVRTPGDEQLISSSWAEKSMKWTSACNKLVRHVRKNMSHFNIT